MFGLHSNHELSIRTIQRHKKSVGLLLGFSVLITVLAVYAFVDSLIVQSSRVASVISPLQRQDVQNCVMSYSYPRYIEMDPPDSPSSNKYKLYLYREGNLDLQQDELYGVPALFIPGQAGSYKQVRSLASATTKCYHYDHCSRQNIDYFTVDLNEELSAMDGKIVLDQAEYMNAAIRRILSQYKDSEHQPQSVLIIGHSMGGFVARTMFMLRNYVPDSIQTVLTLATPHLAAPLLLERNMYHLYQDVTSFWQRHQNESLLKNVVVASIAGGSLDTIVHSDGVSINEIVPATHGFTAYTTSIANVWTGTDHMAILWCKQLVRLLASTLLQLTDMRVARPSVEARMSILRKNLLTDKDYSMVPTEDKHLQGSEFEQTLIRPNSEISSMILFDNDEPSTLLIPLSAGPVNLLTSINRQDDHCWAVSVCSSSSDVIDNPSIQCNPVSPDITVIPSLTAVNLVGTTPNRLMTVSADGSFQYVRVEKKCRAGSFGEPAFIKTYTISSQPILHNTTLWRLMTNGLLLNTTSHQNVHALPNIRSSLFSYDVHIRSITNTTSTDALFKPMMVTRIDQSEPRFYRQLEQGISDRITFHRDASRHRTGLSLEFFLDNQQLEVKISIDWYGTLGRVIHRYGAVLANFCWVNTLMVLVVQMFLYAANGKREYFSYTVALISCLKGPFLSFAALLSASNLCQHYLLSHPLLSKSTISQFISNYTLPDCSEWPFAVLMVFLYLLSIGLVITAWAIFSFLLWLPARVLSLSSNSSLRHQPSEVKFFSIQTAFAVAMVSVIPTSISFIAFLFIWIILTCRARIRAKSDFPKVQNEFNYRFSWLMFFMACVPYYLPSAIIHICHEASVGWTIPVFGILSFLQDLPLLLTMLWLVNGGKHPDTLNSRHMRSVLRITHIVVLYQLLFGFLHPFPFAHIISFAVHK